MDEVIIHEADKELHRRWLNIVNMRGRTSAAPLAPRWGRFRTTGLPGIDWLAAMERWEAGGYRGEKPDDFERYVAVFFQPISC